MTMWKNERHKKEPASLTNKTRSLTNNRGQIQYLYLSAHFFQNRSFSSPACIMPVMKTWKQILQLDKKSSELTDSERRILITDHLEVLSIKKCFFIPSHPKKCHCLSFLQGHLTYRKAIASYILVWASMDKLPQQLTMIQQIKLVNTLIKSASTSFYRGKEPFPIPFFSVDDATANENLTLSTITICKHSYAALHNIGRGALGALECHAKDNTFPIHGNVGRISGRDKKYNEQVLPFLQDFFTNEIIPLAGARPTRFTRDTVLERIEVRDTTDVLELDPGNSKHRL